MNVNDDGDEESCKEEQITFTSDIAESKRINSLNVVISEKWT